MKKIILLSLVATVISNCAQMNPSKMGVKPWERGVLARPEMALDNDPLTSALNDHIYFSKEGSSGGRGFAGGGCGCN
jgi:hypothetical protein